MPTLICFALKEEAAPFRKIASGMASPPDILLVGIGRQNAEKSLCEFLSALGSAPASGAASDAPVAGIRHEAGRIAAGAAALPNLC